MMRYEQDVKTLTNLRESNFPVYIWGNMNTARSILRELKRNGISPTGFVVDSLFYNGESTMEGIPIRCIDELTDIDSCNIVIGFDNVEKTKALFSLERYLRFSIFHLISLDKSIGWSVDFLSINSNKLDDLKNNLSDHKSKDVFDALKNAYTGGDINNLISLADSNQYFNELTFVADSSDEIFIDCGAYNGDTVRLYDEFTNGKYKKIIALEPCKENLVLLENNTKNLRNLQIINKGAWKCDGKLNFQSDTSASFVSEGGDTDILVTAIDNIVNENDRVTFIKMDIEGSEYEALCGAKKTIERDHPKLAVCVYHKNEDLIRLFNLIRSFKGSENYRYYLRHHSNRLTETVMYVI